MDIKAYLERRQEWLRQLPKRRTFCTLCYQPQFSCFCHLLQPFDAKIDFLILNHPIEAARRIATGRLSHLALMGSKLWVGHNFGAHIELNQFIKDRERQCLLLYPGRQSVNVSQFSRVQMNELLDRTARLTIVVVDGTWNTARQMVNQSPNLKSLPQICFTPTKLSRFRLRKQPRPECLSTVEAIHHLIDIIGPSVGFDILGRRHDHLLELFDHLVETSMRQRL